MEVAYNPTRQRGNRGYRALRGSPTRTQSARQRARPAEGSRIQTRSASEGTSLEPRLARASGWCLTNSPLAWYLEEMIRRVLSVLAGYVVTLVLFALGYVLLLQVFPNDIPRPGAAEAPSPGVLALAALFSFLAALVGGCLTTLLAGRSQVRQGVALAGVILVLGLLKPAVDPDREPFWAHLIVVLGGVVGAVVGSFLWVRGWRRRAD
jgi:hypothetical protein